MDNPYRPSEVALLYPSTSIDWKRIIVWACLIYIALSAVAFLSGLTMMDWERYGSTMDEAIANIRLIRRIAMDIVGVFLYWWFATGVASRRLHQVTAVFVLVQIIDLPVAYFLFGAPAGELFDAWSVGRSFLAAMIGSGLASMGYGKPFKPKTSGSDGE